MERPHEIWQKSACKLVTTTLSLIAGCMQVQIIGTLVHYSGSTIEICTGIGRNKGIRKWTLTKTRRRSHEGSKSIVKEGFWRKKQKTVLQTRKPQAPHKLLITVPGTFTTYVVVNHNRFTRQTERNTRQTER